MDQPIKPEPANPTFTRNLIAYDLKQFAENVRLRRADGPCFMRDIKHQDHPIPEFVDVPPHFLINRMANITGPSNESMMELLNRKSPETSANSNSNNSGSANSSHKKAVSTFRARFQCLACDACFETEKKLKFHVKFHSDDRPYRCDTCEKSFKQLGHLKQHERIHTGERPYKCSMCDKCFRQATALKNHVMIHTDRYPYKCEDCGKFFRQSSNLHSHRTRKHDAS